MKTIIIYVISIMILIAQPTFAAGRSGNNIQHGSNNTVTAKSNQQIQSPSPVVKPMDKPETK